MNINLLTEVEVESLNRLIDEANHIAIYTHRSPDGDAIGSTLGMANYLKQRGKEDVKVIVPDMFPNFLQWLPGTMDILRHDKKRRRQKRLPAMLTCCCVSISTMQAGRLNWNRSSRNLRPTRCLSTII